MEWWEAALLGLVQGLTEFLPVSSSGHLVLGQYLLGLDTEGAGDITFEVFVHFGTVLSILTVYRHRIGHILVAALRGLRSPSSIAPAFRKGPIEQARDDEREAPLEDVVDEGAPHPAPTDPYRPSLRLALFILLSMIPTGIVYVLFKDSLEGLYDQPRVVAGMLLVTGTLLALARLNQHPRGVLSAPKSLLVGLAQGAAMIPGISRSGSTICTAIYMNVDRKQAADFSFLMSLPVIVGATAIKALDLFEVGMTMGVVPLVVGTLVAYVAGVWAIRVMLDFVKRGDLWYFAVYCYIVGIVGLVFI